LIRCLAIGVLFLRAWTSSGMYLPSRCLAMGIHVTVCCTKPLVHTYPTTRCHNLEHHNIKRFSCLYLGGQYSVMRRFRLLRSYEVPCTEMSGCANLDLENSWRSVVRFKPRPLYPSLDRRLGGPGTGLDDVKGGKSFPYRDSNSNPYTDCAIPVPVTYWICHTTA
jgi:hypothetical protein